MTKEPSFENAIAFAADLIRIPGLSGREGDVAQRVLGEMQALGFRDIRVDEVGNVIGVIQGLAKAPPVLLNCHLDVVDEGDHDAWEIPPFSGEILDGVLHGRGSMDIKGPLALMTYAAAGLSGSVLGDVIVAHTVFEERGGLGMKHLLDSSSLNPGAVIIGEATHGDVCIGHRGRAELEVTVEGVAGHASVPERARYPLDLVGDVLSAIADLSDDERCDPVLGQSSAVATMVRVLPESHNVIPDRAVVVVDLRILPDTHEQDVVAELRALIGVRLGNLPEGLSYNVRLARETQRTYTGLESDWGLFTPGFLMNPEHQVVRAAAEAVGRRDGIAENAEVRPWKFATDGGWSCGVFGIPTVGFAPGEECYAHTNREQLSLEEARWAFDRYPALVTAVQESLVA